MNLAIHSAASALAYGRSERLTSRRQSDAPPEVNKARVGVEFVQTRVGCQINGQQVGPFFVGLIEPGECLILFSQPCINDRDVVGRDVAVRGY